jgi:isocitrate dehydrogenase (NAD+)
LGKTIAENILSDRSGSDANAGVIAQGEFVTYDMKADRDDPTAVGTVEVVEAVIKKLKE